MATYEQILMYCVKITTGIQLLCMKNLLDIFIFMVVGTGIRFEVIPIVCLPAAPFSKQEGSFLTHQFFDVSWKLIKVEQCE